MFCARFKVHSTFKEEAYILKCLSIEARGVHDAFWPLRRLTQIKNVSQVWYIYKWLVTYLEDSLQANWRAELDNHLILGPLSQEHSPLGLTPDITCNFLFRLFQVKHCLFLSFVIGGPLLSRRFLQWLSSKLEVFFHSLDHPLHLFLSFQTLKKNPVLLCKKRVVLLALPFFSVPVTWASTLVPRHLKKWKCFQGYPSPICNSLFCYIWQGSNHATFVKWIVSNKFTAELSYPTYKRPGERWYQCGTVLVDRSCRNTTSSWNVPSSLGLGTPGVKDSSGSHASTSKLGRLLVTNLVGNGDQYNTSC